MVTELDLEKNKSSQKEFQTLLNKDFENRKLKENSIIKATVTEITKNFVIVDCKAKMEGMIPLEEFKGDEELKNLKVGSKLDVFLERIESFKGELIISRDKAKKMKAWQRLEKVFENQEEMTAYITGKVKGGFIAVVENLPCFMPSSQIDVKPLKRVDHLMNTPVKVIATRIDKTRGNVCVSRRAVLEKSKSAETAEALKNIKEGDVVTSTVKNILDWGIFLDINGLDALLHVSQLSHGRVKKPSDLASIGQKLKVKIIKIDSKTNHISASVKALTENPFENIDKRIKVGEIYEGVVQKVLDYGAFISIDENIEGLCHSSEMDWTNKNIKPSKVFSVSQKVKVKVVSIDKESKRISLSYKATLENPWNKVKNLVGKETEIKIINITDKALFGEIIDNGLSGILHFKELSWSENIDDLKKFKRGDRLKVKVIAINDEKIKFSKRSIEKDPLDWFKDNKKKVGSIISTKVVEVLKTGVKVAVDPEKKIIVMIKKNQLAIEPADCRPEIYNVGNTMADALIEELDYEKRRIVLSPKAAQKKEQDSLIKKFGEGAAKSGLTLKSIFDKAIGKKEKKK